MTQGNTLRTPRASAGMQDQGNVVGRGLSSRNSGGSTRHVNVSLVVHFHRNDWNLAVGGGAAHKFRADRRAQQNASIGVSEKKKKLLVGIRRVQRGCCASDGGSEKADDRR